MDAFENEFVHSLLILRVFQTGHFAVDGGEEPKFCFFERFVHQDDFVRACVCNPGDARDVLLMKFQ